MGESYILRGLPLLHVVLGLVNPAMFGGHPLVCACRGKPAGKPTRVWVSGALKKSWAPFGFRSSIDQKKTRSRNLDNEFRRAVSTCRSHQGENLKTYGTDRITLAPNTYPSKKKGCMALMCSGARVLKISQFPLGLGHYFVVAPRPS